MEQFIDWSPDHGVNHTVLEGEISSKVAGDAFFGAFRLSEEVPAGIVFLPLTRYGDQRFSYYRSQILRLNPFEEPKVKVPTIKNGQFAEEVTNFYSENNLPIALFAFGKDFLTQKDVVSFYYPWGMEAWQALYGFQVHLRQVVAKES